MAGVSTYGFVRDAPNAQAWDDYHKMGLQALLMNVEDPRFSAGLQAAIQQGFQGGLWIPAHTGADPIQYAHQMAQYAAKYHPSVLVPNIEYQGKGIEGSPGWDWSEKMMAEFRRLNPTQKLAVSTMGEDDFNYGAYTTRGAEIMAQSYDGDMHPWSTDNMYDRLVKRGLDPNLFNFTVAPGGHLGSKGNAFSVYTLDDMNPAQRAQYIREMQSHSPYAPPLPPLDTGPDPTPDVLARMNRTTQDARLLGENTTGHILSQREVNALTPRQRVSVAVQRTVSKPPTRASTKARTLIKKATK